MNLAKMTCGILLLIILASIVCGTPLSHHKALFYQAAENSNITVEWSFASKSSITIPSLKIHCVHLPELKVFFHLDNSAEEDQDEQFAGRVQCDEEALTTGRVRLWLSRVRTPDSGKYLCRMASEFGRKVKEFALIVTPATAEPSVVTEPPEPACQEPAGRSRASLFVVLGVVVAVASALAVCRCASVIRPWTSK